MLVLHLLAHASTFTLQDGTKVTSFLYPHVTYGNGYKAGTKVYGKLEYIDTVSGRDWSNYCDATKWPNKAILKGKIGVGNAFQFYYCANPLVTTAKCGWDTFGTIGMLGFLAFGPVQYGGFTSVQGCYPDFEVLAPDFKFPDIPICFQDFGDSIPWAVPLIYGQTVYAEIVNDGNGYLEAFGSVGTSVVYRLIGVLTFIVVVLSVYALWLSRATKSFPLITAILLQLIENLWYTIKGWHTGEDWSMWEQHLTGKLTTRVGQMLFLAAVPLQLGSSGLMGLLWAEVSRSKPMSAKMKSIVRYTTYFVLVACMITMWIFDHLLFERFFTTEFNLWYSITTWVPSCLNLVVGLFFLFTGFRACYVLTKASKVSGSAAMSDIIKKVLPWVVVQGVLGVYGAIWNIIFTFFWTGVDETVLFFPGGLNNFEGNAGYFNCLNLPFNLASLAQAIAFVQLARNFSSSSSSSSSSSASCA